MVAAAAAAVVVAAAATTAAVAAAAAVGESGRFEGVLNEHRYVRVQDSTLESPSHDAGTYRYKT